MADKKSLNMNTQIKLIAFDLDGTLVDSALDISYAVNAALSDVEQPTVSAQAIKDYLGNGADILMRRALSQDLTPNEHLDPDLVHALRQSFDKHYEQGGHQYSKTFENVENTLDTLHKAGVIMALLTNKPACFIPEILAKHHLSPYFSEIIGGDTLSQNKPHPIGLLWLMEKYSLSTDEILMVGDSKNDILAAKAAGVASFGMTYGYNHGESITTAEPTVVADNLIELLNFIGLSQAI